MSYTYDVISENESEADIRLPQEGYDSYLLKSHSKTTEAKFAFVNDNFLYVFYTPGESAERYDLRDSTSVPETYNSSDLLYG